MQATLPYSIKVIFLFLFDSHIQKISSRITFFHFLISMANYIIAFTGKQQVKKWLDVAVDDV